MRRMACTSIYDGARGVTAEKRRHRPVQLSGERACLSMWATRSRPVVEQLFSRKHGQERFVAVGECVVVTIAISVAGRRSVDDASLVVHIFLMNTCRYLVMRYGVSGTLSFQRFNGSRTLPIAVPVALR